MRGARAAILGGVVALGATGLAVIRGQLHNPAPVESVPIACADDAPRARAGDALTVLVWNAQFSAGRARHFFYDGGRDVAVPLDEVEGTLDALAEVVRRHDPDVILWQELDRSSDRTGRVDQVRALLDRLGDYPCHASTPYHRAGYVPFPFHEPLGRVDMHLAVFSRVRLTDATRHQLALLDEPAWRRAFNLRRAVLDVRVPVDGGPDLRLFNTHLSAFSRGDGTLPRQVGQLQRLVEAARADGDAVLLAGDLNALPPGEDPATVLEKDRVLYQDGEGVLKPLYDTLEPALPLARYRQAPERYYTYVPFGGTADRTIDHAFVGGSVVSSAYQVDGAPVEVSDHLPLIFEVRVASDDDNAPAAR